MGTEHEENEQEGDAKGHEPACYGACRNEEKAKGMLTMAAHRIEYDGDVSFIKDTPASEKPAEESPEAPAAQPEQDDSAWASAGESRGLSREEALAFGSPEALQVALDIIDRKALAARRTNKQEPPARQPDNSPRKPDPVPDFEMGEDWDEQQKKFNQHLSRKFAAIEARIEQAEAEKARLEAEVRAARESAAAVTQRTAQREVELAISSWDKADQQAFGIKGGRPPSQGEPGYEQFNKLIQTGMELEQADIERGARPDTIPGLLQRAMRQLYPKKQEQSPAPTRLSRQQRAVVPNEEAGDDAALRRIRSFMNTKGQSTAGLSRR